MNRISNKILKICEICNKEFFVFPCQETQRFCSQKCGGIFHSGIGNPMHGVIRRGPNAPMWGKKMPESAKQRLREIALLRPRPSKETREKLRTWIGRKHTEEEKKKIGEAHRGKKRQPFSVEWKKKIGNWNKGKPKTESHRQKLIIHLNRVRYYASQKRPTKPELKLSQLITLPDLHYVGDRSWWRKLPNGKYKNPDFKIKGQNKVIEVFGDYWHQNDDPEELKALYKQIGLDCLVIWEKEINLQPELVKDKVNNFISV